MNQIPSQSTEPYYDIPLINDIHTHFPELLYNIDRFESVRDVLLYVRSQVQARYDRFSTASENYNYTTQNMIRTGGGGGGAAARRTATTTANTTTPARRPAAATTPPPAPLRAASANNIIAPPMYTTRINLNDMIFPFTAASPFTTTPPPQPVDMEMDNATALFTLLGLMAQPAPNPTLFDPVTVRPSQAVIDRATQLETLIQQAGDPPLCVICQDEMIVSNRVRHIRQCGHIFHDSCILQHFENSVRCPTCRYDIRDISPTNP